MPVIPSRTTAPSPAADANILHKPGQNSAVAGTSLPDPPGHAADQACQRYVPPFMRQAIETFMQSERQDVNQNTSGNVVHLEGKFAPSVQATGSEKLFRQRFIKAFELFAKADACLSEPLLELFNNSNACLYLTTDEKLPLYGHTRLYLGSARELDFCSENYLAVAQAIFRGDKLDVVVTLNGSRNFSGMGNMQRIAHTLNHELSLHAAQCLHFFNTAKSLSSVQEIVDLLCLEDTTPNMLSASKHHASLAAIGDSMRLGEVSWRLLDTHQAMLEKLSSQTEKQRLQADFDADIRRHRNEGF